ncbi:MAG: hypothetical protein KKE55_03900 [Candidatus Omnitrophica bacterium]|nr:hypothetical protein [Candidatus Omnitrophota bacterium]MBU2504968.1 hypothetical protein [Candidatus Omnitrophota bacterium]
MISHTDFVREGVVIKRLSGSGKLSISNQSTTFGLRRLRTRLASKNYGHSL